MDFRVDTYTWFIFSILFISALLLFIIGYIAIPYFIGKRQLKRIRLKYIRKNDQYEQLEKRNSKREILNLELRNQVLKTDLNKKLHKLLKADSDKPRVHTFHSEFEKAYPHFNDSLQKVIPNITIHELKLCSLIRMNLTAKEISRLLNITPASVNKARYRL
ncbi:MAG TPA: hypothetical protein VFI78_03125, partial [Salinimicrobium sp.]|nr:hypothetical protein [Salinimicrobium sp.]